MTLFAIRPKLVSSNRFHVFTLGLLMRWRYSSNFPNTLPINILMTCRWWFLHAVFITAASVGEGVVVVKLRSWSALSGLMTYCILSGCVWHRCRSLAWGCWSASLHVSLYLLSVFIYVILLVIPFSWWLQDTVHARHPQRCCRFFMAGVLAGICGVVCFCVWMFCFSSDLWRKISTRLLSASTVMFLLLTIGWFLFRF